MHTFSASPFYVLRHHLPDIRPPSSAGGLPKAVRSTTTMADEDRPPAPPVRMASVRFGGEPGGLPLPPLPREPDAERRRRAKLAKQTKRHTEKPAISYPTNFEHAVHVGFDPATGEFSGMPPLWVALRDATYEAKALEILARHTEGLVRLHDIPAVDPTAGSKVHETWEVGLPVLFHPKRRRS